MSTRHLLDSEGAVVCTASPAEDGSNVTSDRALATCFNCRHPMPKRIPYVGEGRDGCLRSARIDREEADGMSPGEDRDARLSSAFSWERQAEQEPA